MTAAAPMSVRWVPMSGMVTSGGQEGPHQAARGGQGEDAPGRRAGLLHVADADADGERRHRAQQQHRGHEQDHAGEERAEHGAGGHRVDPVDGDVEERPGHEGDDGREDGAGQDQEAQQPLARPPVGQPAAERRTPATEPRVSAR